MSPLMDTHCHLDFPVFDPDRVNILQQCKEQGIQAIVVPAVSANHWQRLLNLCEAEKMLFPALGLHPCFLVQHQKEHLQQLDVFCQSGKMVALGEIGLDYRKNKNGKAEPARQDLQRFYFEHQLQLAQKYHLPVLIHAVKAHQDVLGLLKHYYQTSEHLSEKPSGQRAKGIIHAYSGSYEQALEYLKLGFKLGFGGAYTYPKARKLRALVSRLPLEAWVLETDAPDMSPESHYGQRNSPQYLPEIARVFVSLYDKGLNPDEILKQLYINSLNIFPESG